MPLEMFSPLFPTSLDLLYVNQNSWRVGDYGNCCQNIWKTTYSVFCMFHIYTYTYVEGDKAVHTFILIFLLLVKENNAR